MSTARQAFIDRVSAFRSAIDTEVVTSKAPTETVHNARARIFRNGLAVVGFAALEEFIKRRTGEVLSRIGYGPVRFGELPQRLQHASTIGVISAIRFQNGLQRTSPTASPFGFVQQHANFIASTASTAYALSPISFGHDRSNISDSDIESILSAFQVDNPWNAMGSIASRAGAGVVALRDVILAAAERRHRAAHDANCEVEYGDLKDYHIELVAVALSFDLLLSKALRRFLDGDRSLVRGTRKLTGKDVRLVRVVPAGSEWRELPEGKRRARARGRDFSAIKTNAIAKARTTGNALIISDKAGLPSAWYTPEID